MIAAKDVMRGDVILISLAPQKKRIVLDLPVDMDMFVL